MAEETLSLEQQQAVALASARLRAQQSSQPSPPVQEPSTFQKLVGGIGGQAPSLVNMMMGAGNAAAGIGQEAVGKIGYGAGEKATDAASSAGFPPNVAAGVGYAANVGTQAVPTVLGGYLGSAAGGLLKSGGEKIMRMALKPSTTLSPARSTEAVQTMLNAKVGNLMPGANVTPSGIEQLQTKIGDLGQQVDKLGAGSTAQINKYQLAKALRETEAKYGPARSVNPLSDLKSIADVKSEFLATHPTNMSVSDALNLKQGTYQNLGEKAYKGTELKGSEVAAQKTLAKALRQETEKAVPEIAPVNAEQSNLINAIKAAISRNAIAGNKDPIGLGFIASNPKAAAAFMANRSELIKSELARLLYHLGKPTGTAIGAGAGGLYANQQGQQ